MKYGDTVYLKAITDWEARDGGTVIIKIRKGWYYYGTLINGGPPANPGSVKSPITDRHWGIYNPFEEINNVEKLLIFGGKIKPLPLP